MMEDEKNVKIRGSMDAATDVSSDAESEIIRIADLQLFALGHKAELKRVHTFWTRKYGSNYRFMF